ncbi:hypothetical protein CFP56_031685 [Quercus suber]|uniref:Uncharacterized protein n=1 Tax=Quercus suber TaxID=58331 RepID=A0AAW0JJE7_QUESU
MEREREREREREGVIERGGAQTLSVPGVGSGGWDPGVGHCPNQCTMSLTNRWIIPHLFFYGAVAGTIERERERDQWWVLMTPLRQLAPPRQLINLDRSFVFVGPIPFDGHIE